MQIIYKFVHFFCNIKIVDDSYPSMLCKSDQHR